MAISTVKESGVVIVPVSDNLNTLPAELEAIYSTLPSDIVQLCEQHRLGIMRDALTHLRAIHDALTPYGLFKDWCKAVGIRYGSANYRLSVASGTKNNTASTLAHPKQIITTVSKWGEISEDATMHRLYSDVSAWLENISDADERFDRALDVQRIGYMLYKAGKKFTNAD